jgi:hypothetical protein
VSLDVALNEIMTGSCYSTRASCACASYGGVAHAFSLFAGAIPPAAADPARQPDTVLVKEA